MKGGRFSSEGVRGALAVLLAAAVAPQAPASWPDEDDGFDRARAALETLQATPTGSPVCERSGAQLRYVGPSGASLAACIEAHPGVGRLVVTSMGGSVRAALASARRVDAAELDVEVVGVCFSSCANYIVPAARTVAVAPFSAIVLHGGPAGDAETLRASLREALSRAGAPEPALERHVEIEVAKALELRAEHDQFAARHSVSQEWYDLTAFANRRAANGRGAVIAASADWLALCAPELEIADFWFPRDRATARALEQSLSLGAIWFVGLDTPPVGDC